ncbi:MAG TPA: hypothetical protein PKG95_11525, partial [Anaerolineaceae bacterium]|nr:hypothetical protein [Anaerolineaceae bacterium]
MTNADTFTIAVNAFGYQPESVSGVVLTTGATVVTDFALDELPTTQVSGYVYDNSGHNYPLYASLNFSASGFDQTIFTDPFSGYYEIELYLNATYTVLVEAVPPGYTPHLGTFTPDTSPDTQNYYLNIDPISCSAPGYQVNVTNLLTENFDSMTPPNISGSWAVVDTSGTGGNWRLATATVHPSGVAPYSSPNLAYFNSWTATTGQATRLQRTVGLDLSAQTNVVAKVYVYHDTQYTNTDTLQLQISTNSGSTWNNVGDAIQRYDGSTGWKLHTVNLDAYTGAGFTNVRLGLLGTSAYGNDIHIDSVSITSQTCTPVAGGVVAGYVFDENTAATLVGATVSSPTVTTETFALPEDPDNAGIYWAFQATASNPQSVAFTATYPEYTADAQTVAVVQNAITRQDFYLGAGQLSFSPATLEATMQLGDAPLTQNWMISNPGTAAATYELLEIAGGFTPAALPPSIADLPVLQNERRGELSLANEASTDPVGPDEIVPMADIELILDDGTAENNLGLTSGGQILWLNRFTLTPDDLPFRLEEVWALFPTTVAVGDDMQVVVYSDADGNPANGALYLGGETFTVVNNNRTTWNVFTLTTPITTNTAGDLLIGLVNRSGADGYVDRSAVMDTTSSQGRSWIGLYVADPPATPTLPADDTFDIIDNLGLPCNWAIRGMGTYNSTDVPWLSENPTTGSIPESGSATVQITYDVSTLSQTGDYTASLKIVNNTPYSYTTVPVTLHVTAANTPPVAVADAYSLDEDTTLTVAAPGVL